VSPSHEHRSVHVQRDIEIYTYAVFQVVDPCVTSQKKEKISKLRVRVCRGTAWQHGRANRHGRGVRHPPLFQSENPSPLAQCSSSCFGKQTRKHLAVQKWHASAPRS